MCSTIIFGPNGRKCLAQNYDYSLDHGLVEKNLRGTKKSNGGASPENGVSWAVKYGSITFNQFSLELPVSGMNEAGLAIALMWHEEGDFGANDNYLRLNELQWIQYQLDNYENIAQVVDGLGRVRPERGPLPLHFSLLDVHGDSLLLEFIEGEPVLHSNAAYPILTNNSYHSCLAEAEKGENRDEKSLNNSLGRYVCLHQMLSNCQDHELPVDGFRYLDSASQSPDNVRDFPWSSNDNNTVTAWSIVFDPAIKSILLKTNRNNTIRELSMDDFNFDVDGEYQLMDVHAGGGSATMECFEPYSKEKNVDILQLAGPTVGLPQQVLNELADAVDQLYLNRQLS